MREEIARRLPYLTVVDETGTRRLNHETWPAGYPVLKLESELPDHIDIDDFWEGILWACLWEFERAVVLWDDGVEVFVVEFDYRLWSDGFDEARFVRFEPWPGRSASSSNIMQPVKLATALKWITSGRPLREVGWLVQGHRDLPGRGDRPDRDAL